MSIGGSKTLFIDRKKQIARFLAVYTALFILTFLLSYSPFLQEGKTLIWSNNDGRTQHYPTLVYVGRYLRQIVLNLLHGELAIPLFDLNLAMGSDVIATLNYYGLGNPLYLLSAFVPTRYTEYLFNALIVLRIYLADLSFSALCAYHGKPQSHALVGALMYSFSGYMIFSVLHHPYFAEPMIQLPLLLIGIDQVIRRKRPFVFILSVFYSALCGFYFLYMMTLMLGAYTLVRFFDCYQRERVKEFFRMAGRIIGAYLIGIGLSAPVFFPAVFGYLSSSRSGMATEWNYFSYGWAYYRNNIPKLIAPAGSWIALSLAAIALPAIVLLLAQRKSRRSLKLLLGICAMIYVLPLGGYVMNGFSYPIQRWTFGAALLCSYIVVEMLPVLLNLTGRQQAGCFVTLLAYNLCIFANTSTRNVYHVVGAAMLAATLFTLLLVRNIPQAQRNWKLCDAGVMICVLIIVGNVGINAIFRFAKDQGNEIGQHAAYGTETERLESAIEREAEPYLGARDGRFDSSSFSLNVGAVWRVPNMRTYWSITNGNISTFYEKTENTAQQHSPHTVAGTNERTGANALFSTKYFIERGDKTQYVPYGYSLREETENGNLIYENQYALPWGYTYDSYISYSEMEAMNGLQVEEAMLQHIALDGAIEVVPRGAVESNVQKQPFEIAESSSVEWKDGILTVSKENAEMVLDFQMPAKVEGYLRLEGFDISHSGQSSFVVTAKCEGISRTMNVLSTDYTWYYGRENYLANLGYSEQERTRCTITFPKKGTYRLADIQLFALPMENYSAQIEALRAEPLENIAFGTNCITGTVDLSQNKVLCMSIPYSSGWTARVDGEKVDILRGNYMFMALPLEAGTHQVEFTYCTPGLRLGIVAALLSCGGMAALAVQYKRRSSRERK